MLTRRSFLQAALASSAAAITQPAARALEAAQRSSLALEARPGATLASIPSHFIGLGYEMSSAARLGLLSPDNRPYVQLIRNLGPKGVLRLGGIVADYTTYAADGQVLTNLKHTVVTRQSLQQLRAFLDAIEWSALWSLNFGHGTLEDAITEARDVAQTLGPRLLAVELGNEVENYAKGSDPRRPTPYTYETYRAEYTRWHRALLAAVPNLRFAAPDSAASIDWVERMAVDAHGDVQLLTTHYYRGDQKLGTQDQLLNPDPTLLDNLARLRRASAASSLPWRLCETNSFFGGGRPGLSDTLAGALWTLDFMLLLAQNGCAGVNLETGVNQLGFISSYSPIQDDNAGHNTAGAPYYGMLAFALATQHSRDVLTRRRPQASSAAHTVYALGAAGRVQTVVLINKSPKEPLHLPLNGFGLRSPGALLLTGPSLDSKSGVTLGGTAVDSTGHWHRPQPIPVRANTVEVPPASALIVRSTA